MNKQDEAAYRVSMERELHRHGFDVRPDASIEHLERLMRSIDAPRVEQFEGVVAKAKEAMK